MLESQGPEPQKSPESKQKVITRQIINIPEERKGTLFELRNNETLEITSQGYEGSQNKMLIYGGAGSKIGFDDLGELLKKKCQIYFSLGVNFPEKNAGKAVITWNGIPNWRSYREGANEIMSPGWPQEEAMAHFKQGLEREKNQPSIKESQNKPTIEIVSVLEKLDNNGQKVKLKINGAESPFVWENYGKKDEFYLNREDLGKITGYLKIPYNTRLYILTDNNGIVNIAGGNNSRIPLEELRNICKNPGSAVIRLMGRDYEKWTGENSIYPTEPGTANFTDAKATLSGSKENISVSDALKLLQQSEAKEAPNTDPRDELSWQEVFDNLVTADPNLKQTLSVTKDYFDSGTTVMEKIDKMRSAVEKNPQDLNSWHDLGTISRDYIKDPYLVDRIFKETIKNNPQDTDTRLFYAIALEVIGQGSKSVEVAEKAIEEGLVDGRSLNHFAGIFKDTGQPPEKMDKINKAFEKLLLQAEKEKDYVSTSSRYALTLARVEGKNDRAIELFEDLARKYKENPSVWVNYSYLLGDVGKKAEIPDLLRRAVAEGVKADDDFITFFSNNVKSNDQKDLSLEGARQEIERIRTEANRFKETAGARESFLKSVVDPERRKRMDEIFSKIVLHNNQLILEDMDLWAEENQYLKVPNSFWHDSKETLRAFEESDVEKALLSKENLDQFRQILVEQNAAQNGRIRTALLVEFIYRPPESKKDLEVFNEFAEILKRTKKNFKNYFGYMDVMSWLRSDLRGHEDTVEKIIKDLDRTDN